MKICGRQLLAGLLAAVLLVGVDGSVPERWRGNNYINDDGDILPWAMCKDGPFVTGRFTLPQSGEQSVVVLGASVWGPSEPSSGRPTGKIRSITVLLYTQPPDRPCRWFYHCLQDAGVAGELQISATLYRHSSDSAKERTPLSHRIVGRLQPTSSTLHAVFDLSPSDFLLPSAAELPDAWALDLVFSSPSTSNRVLGRWLGLGARSSPDDKKRVHVVVPMCYQHVASAAAVAVCTNILWGSSFLTAQRYDVGAHRWPDGDHLLRDFLLYYTVLHSAPVHISEAGHVLGSRLDHFRRLYHRSCTAAASSADSDSECGRCGGVSYRGGWNEDLYPAGFVRNAAEEAGDECIAHEFLADNHCTWQFRLSARWVLLLNIDHFTMSHSAKNRCLAKIFGRIVVPPNTAALIIPHQRAHTLVNLTRAQRAARRTYTALDRFAATGPELQDGAARATPVQNPRLTIVSRIHDIELANGRSVAVDQVAALYGLHSVHLMGWTRPDLDVPQEARPNPSVDYWAKRLNQKLAAIGNDPARA